MSARGSSGWLFWLVALGLLGGGGWWWQTKNRAGKASDIEYRTAAVSRSNIVQSVSANGSLTAVRNVEVGSQVSGIIKEILVDFNSQVKAGQILAKIDPATYERALARVEAELVSSQASLELAEFNFKRAKELFAIKLISETEFTQSQVTLHQAEAGVKIREAAVESARVDLERTTITAPIDGMIISRAVEAGQTVASSFNTPRLFAIANDLRKMQIECGVPEADVGGVTEGQPVTFTVDAFPSRTFRGIVKQVRYAPTTNQNVVTYTSIVEVDNSEMKLRPGMTANTSIITSEKRNVLRVPNAALRFTVPPNAIVIKLTNSPPSTTPSGTNQAASSARSGGDTGDMPVPPWRAENRRPTDEERTKWMASLTPEQRERYQAMRDRMMQRMASGEGGSEGGGMRGTGGSGSPSRSEGPTTRTLHVVVKETDQHGKVVSKLRQVSVKCGIGDSGNTEIIEGLQEGDLVAIGSNAPMPAPAGGAMGMGGMGGSPFGGSPFGGGGGPRR